MLDVIQVRFLVSLGIRQEGVLNKSVKPHLRPFLQAILVFKELVLDNDRGFYRLLFIASFLQYALNASSVDRNIKRLPTKFVTFSV